MAYVTTVFVEELKELILRPVKFAENEADIIPKFKHKT